jgi:hypothetical protein
LERRGIDPVARTFIVEGKPAGAMADLVHATLVTIPAKTAGTGRRARRAIAVDRIERAVREHVLDIGDDQFLVLLLVMTTELDQVEHIVRGIIDQRAHIRIDLRAIAMHLGESRARHQSALRARMAVAHCLVVGIEEVVITLVDLAVSLDERH